MIEYLKKYYCIIILLILLIIVNLNINKPTNDSVETYILNKKIDSLYIEINNNNILKKEYQNNIKLYSDSITKINNKLKINYNSYNSLKNKHNDVLSKINSYSNNNVYEYFESRYSSK